MAQTQIAPDWFSTDMEKLVHAGDIEGIRYAQRACETVCVEAVREDRFEDAQGWARRAAVAKAAEEMAVAGVRELRRAVEVTEELMGRDA